MRSLHRTALLAVVAATTACLDEPPTTTPAASGVGMFRQAAAMTSTGARPALVSNSIRYRNLSKPNATGRDGGATLFARALLDRDGMVTLDVSTAEIGGSQSPQGVIDKIQVKGIHTSSGVAMWTDNYTSLRKLGLASYQYTYAGLVPGLQLQVQANISGMDTRTGVVTLLETVKRRPDPAVVALDAPSVVAPGAQVPISAEVRELNGDVGATADCELLVDGHVIDRATGIWVDAGGAVACAFLASFGPGSHAVEVRLTGVTPADWSDANNSASTTVTAASSTSHRHWAQLQHFGTMYDASEWDYRSTYVDAAGNILQQYSYSGSSMNDGARQQAWIQSQVDDYLPWPLTYEASLASGGSELIATSITFPGPGWSWTSSDGIEEQDCAQEVVASPYRSVWACRYRQFDLPSSYPSRSVVFQYTYAGAQIVHGQVVYASNQLEQWYYGPASECQGSCYFASSSSSSGSYDYGPMLPIGSDFAAAAQLTGGDHRSFAATGGRVLAPYESGDGVMGPWSCWSGTLTSNSHSCSRWTYKYRGWIGGIFGYSDTDATATMH